MLVVNTIIHRICMEIELSSAKRDPFLLAPLHGHCDVRRTYEPAILPFPLHSLFNVPGSV